MLHPGEKLIVLIAPDGTVTVEVQGCPGPDCRAKSRPLLDALGAEVVDDQETAEYYQQTPAQNHVRLDQC